MEIFLWRYPWSSIRSLISVEMLLSACVPQNRKYLFQELCSMSGVGWGGVGRMVSRDQKPRSHIWVTRKIGGALKHSLFLESYLVKVKALGTISKHWDNTIPSGTSFPWPSEILRMAVNSKRDLQVPFLFLTVPEILWSLLQPCHCHQIP